MRSFGTAALRRDALAHNVSKLRRLQAWQQHFVVTAPRVAYFDFLANSNCVHRYECVRVRVDLFIKMHITANGASCLT